MFIYVYTQFFE